MRNIRKGAEPKAWVRHRCQKHASFEGCSASAKQSLREGLISEQGEICCYCMQRIYPTWDGMKVEHWASQEDHPGKQMTYLRA